MSITKKNLQKLVKQYTRQSTKLAIDLDGAQVEITVHPILSLSQFGLAAQDIAQMQFLTEKNGDEVYAPYLRSFAERYVLFGYFTDLNLQALEEKTADGGSTIGGVESIWTVLMSGLYDEVMQYVDVGCWRDLLSAADDIVQAKRKAIEPGPQKLWANLDELVDQMKQSFGDMTPEDREKWFNVVEKLNKLDEGSIVELMRK